MGLDDDVVEQMNTDVATAQSLGPMALLPEDLNARREVRYTVALDDVLDETLGGPEELSAVSKSRSRG